MKPLVKAVEVEPVVPDPAIEALSKQLVEARREVVRKAKLAAAEAQFNWEKCLQSQAQAKTRYAASQ